MDENWGYLILGLRKNQRFRQQDLAKILKLNRRTIGRYEEGTRIPNDHAKKRILSLIKEKCLKENKLVVLGRRYSRKIRKISKSIQLDYSPKLAELIGIILGDGCIRKDGEFIISFDPNKDINFINRRVIPLINNLLGKQQFYSSNKKEIRFHNKGFNLFLKEKCNLNGGKKTENGNKIPDWCFAKRDYLRSVLRGIFDTDGTFDYRNSPIIALGRFSGKTRLFVKSIEEALKQLDIEFVTQKTIDHNLVIKLNSREKVINFFNQVGSSNIKHITRFLLWRISKYKARINIDGLKKLILLTNKAIKQDIREIDLPFVWDSNNTSFWRYIKEDIEYLKIIKIRRNLNWNDIIRRLLTKLENKEIAKALKTKPKNVNRWINGDRRPSEIFTPRLLNLIKKYKINV